MTNACYIILAVLLFYLTAPSVHGQTPSDSNRPAIGREGFKPVVSVLRGKTRVPLAIPSSLPKNERVDRFFCTVITLKQNEYEVVIGWTTECDGGNACRVGSLSG